MKAKVHRWTPAQLAMLHKNFPFTRNADLANDLGVNEVVLRNRARKDGLSKAPEFLSQMAMDREHGVCTIHGVDSMIPVGRETIKIVPGGRIILHKAA